MSKWLALFLLGWSCQALSATWQITYPRTDENGAQIDAYPLKLLALALDQTGVKYQLVASENELPKNKALARLKDNREINIVWGMTTEQREQDFLPIRIPIFKGLIGWRLLLIRSDMSARFKYIQQLEHLVKLSPIQGRDWPDTKILQSNGFDVVTESSHEAMLAMLENAQGDFYPRSIVEIWPEVDNLASNSPINIQSNLALHYPAAVYFFVNKSGLPLANLIEKGLEKAIESGQFDTLFLESYGAFIEKSQLQKRTIYSLQNNFLPEKTPLNRKELWFEGSLNTAPK
ncbi:amino acid ABC transporter substrate-binding protein [Paraglaciecola aestuariivivens]